jgi:hypothetical protein
MSEIAKFLPSNTQLLAQRQHEELTGLRQEVEELRVKTALLEQSMEQAEAEQEGLLAERARLWNLATDLTRERDRVIQHLARLLAVQTPPFLLAGLAGGFLALFVLRLWGL